MTEDEMAGWHHGLDGCESAIHLAVTLHLCFMGKGYTTFLSFNGQLSQIILLIWTYSVKVSINHITL